MLSLRENYKCEIPFRNLFLFHDTYVAILYDVFTIDFNINVHFLPVMCGIVSDNGNDLIYELAVTLINCVAHVVYSINTAQLVSPIMST